MAKDDKSKPGKDDPKGKDEAAEGSDEAAPAAEPEKPKGRFSLSAGMVRILKVVLNYLIVAIIAFITAFVVVSQSRDQDVPKEKLFGSDPEFDDGAYAHNPPKGTDWTMSEMILNTADEDFPHTVKCTIIVSIEPGNLELISELNGRQSQIHDAISSIIKNKKFLEINIGPKQTLLKQEIKTELMKIVNMPGIYDIFFKDFMVN